MTAAKPYPLLPVPPPALPFVGRSAEGRALLLSIRAARSVALVAPPAYGKSALLSELVEAVEEITVPLIVPKVAPFTAFLSDLHDAMHGAGIYSPGVKITKDLDTDRATWRKKYAGGNEARARALVEALRLYVQAGHQPPAVLVDDAGGITQAMTPVLVGMAAHAALVLAIYPETLQKAGTRRLWQLCDKVELAQLDGSDSRALVGSLTASYGITTPDTKAYENSVLALSSGIPGEIVRLVRYVPAAEIVKQRGGSALAQNRAAREERGTALAPVLLVLSAVFVIIRVLGRARGEMDAYVIGQVGMAASMILLPLMRRWTAAR
ncbi:ATP-binding protein [Deinococcus detaillensis]|uniref:ATP-binding protein n=1 Tax=Deinococcus detaillensis TaxID=2592048 RepID=A0A553UHG1_9DEIO|nr:ATP-binding protein [Deinococcus detaillensis]TSA79647.1 ATP-binding protein [Deinococcus detaillensis]